MLTDAPSKSLFDLRGKGVLLPLIMEIRLHNFTLETSRVA